MAEVEGIIFSNSVFCEASSNLFFVSVKWQSNNTGINTLPNSFLSGNMKATGLSRQASLRLCLSAERLFCLCCNPPPPHRGPWGRMKDFSPDPNSQSSMERQNNSKAYRKAPNYCFFFFLLLYRCVGLLNRGTTPHWKQSFHPHGKTFIRVRTTPNILITGHFNGLQITPTHCDHCVLSCLDLLYCRRVPE